MIIFKRKITFFIIIGLLFLFSVNVALALNLSDAFKKDSGPLEDAGVGAGYKIIDEPEIIISAVIKTVLSFVGVIFLVLMIYGGYLWMTAKGNEQQVEKAKNLITAAIIGLIIVIAAYAISWFVISKLGGGTTLRPGSPDKAW